MPIYGRINTASVPLTPLNCAVSNTMDNANGPCDQIVQIALTDKRLLLPGEQQPWVSCNNRPSSACQLARGAALDPFDALPIRMPFKSKELFHYFYQFGHSLKIVKTNQAEDCLTLAVNDPHALRNTLLIAGLHYSWNTGDLQVFDSAFFFHKVETIRTVNKLLGNASPKLAVLCISQICTLCYTEACLGNVAVAETHLDGLMTFLDAMEQQNPAVLSGDDADSEHARRYLLITYNFVHNIKSRLRAFILASASASASMSESAQPPSPEDDPSAADALDRMHEWHQIEYLGLENRLKALRVLPSFICPAPSAGPPKRFDASTVLQGLRDVTAGIDKRDIDPTGNKMWNEGAPNRLFVALVNHHAQSFSNEHTTTKPSGSKGGSRSRETANTNPTSTSTTNLLTTWSGITAVMGLYMHSVLSTTNNGDPLDPRLLRRVALEVERDVEGYPYGTKGSSSSITTSTSGHDLWLWKAFVTAIALAKNREHFAKQKRKTIWSSPVPHAGVAKEKHGRDLPSILERMEDRVRRWSKDTGVAGWAEAKAALARVVWPADSSGLEEREFEGVWGVVKIGGE
ncbi:uncharacterized protein GGS25DRAFT_519975 [Hypoxylon fragiforme]|uniref:uncharacterized protein n=1 Tax=Hypoxylon fragiforme TaxID=63214 RepID=UPI0020C73BBF|nr:uncharacterized protein GGS25DRAFT_519975 [Hypoxylon fragiforme]KAI2611663.1 hypothetical protein GGS25DRAFT_519975 [Hypoxylon fragiforme]